MQLKYQSLVWTLDWEANKKLPILFLQIIFTTDIIECIE